MKIFQVVNVRWFNATSWYALYLSMLLSEAGHEVTVLTVPGTDTERKARDMGLDVVTLDLNSTNPVVFAKTIRQVIELLKTRTPDVVNCHRGEGFFLWGTLKLTGYQYGLIRTRGDQRLPKSDPVNQWLHKSVADGVVVTNKRMADHFLQKMNTPEDRLWLVPGGVDRKRFTFDQVGRDRIRREFGFSDEDTVIGLVGRFDRVKGQDELIRAVKALRDEKGRTDVKLFLIGHDTAMTTEDVQSIINANDMNEHTVISGKRDDIEACISALDVGVVASLWSEAIARSALEIMSAGRPLVSSTVGVMPDLVPDEALFTPGDIPAMTDTLFRIIGNPDTRERILETESRTMSQLDGSDFLKRTLSLYENTLDRDGK